jgi:hypothetical protein
MEISSTPVAIDETKKATTSPALRLRSGDPDGGTAMALLFSGRIAVLL